MGLILLGGVATGLALLGAILPGLPTTPFLLVALWAFANSSPALGAWLERVPLLQTALVEARRFEERRAMRREVKMFALAMAWGSCLLTLTLSGYQLTTPVLVTACAGVAATIVVIVIPTDFDA